jgi:hypothetical protein
MADHYVALDQGVNGTNYSDFTTGTASTAGSHLEKRLQAIARLPALGRVENLSMRQFYGLH